jgi:hypothetical protein
MAKTNVFAAQVINVHRGTTLTAPATTYVSLLTVLPAADGTGGTEVSGNGYARQATGFGAPAGTPQTSTNAADILYPVQTPAAYAAVTGIALDTALTVGQREYWTDIADRTFNIGDQAKFTAGALSLVEQ